MAKFFTLVVVLVCSVFVHAKSDVISEHCKIQLKDTEQQPLVLEKETPAFLSLSSGKNHLRLTCDLNEQAIFTFKKNEIINISWDAEQLNIKPLLANHPAYLLPAGQFTIDFELTIDRSIQQKFAWKSIETFLNEHLVNNITMGIFYGLCLTLILYVFFMGRIIGDNRFQFYSLYVFCAATFFLLQEGQLNILLPKYSFLLGHQFYVIFAGLTVVTATVFMVRLTNLYTSWPRLTRFGLELGSVFALCLSVAVLIIDDAELSVMLSRVMANLTLLIMITILILVAIQAKRRVKSAKIALISSVVMIAAMIFRVVFDDFSPFLNRYALIFAFAIEAFILAIAVSSRIKGIRQDKLLAESQANTDVLCNLLNRRGWESQAQALLTEKGKKAGVLCLLYIDLNDFKQINDNLGHDTGDKVLKVIADIIRHQLRSADTIGRIGGDEFVALGHFQHQLEAEGQALRMQKRLSDFILHVDAELSLEVSASVGYVIFDTPPANITDMLIKADEAMYRIKRSRKQTELPLNEV